MERDARTRNATLLLRICLRPPTEVGNYFFALISSIRHNERSVFFFFTNTFVSTGKLGAYPDEQKDGHYRSL